MAGSNLEVPELHTAQQVGETLGGLHPKTVLLMYRRGELPGIRLGSRTVRFDPRDVAAYIDAHRTVAAP